VSTREPTTRKIGLGFNHGGAPSTLIDVVGFQEI